MKKKDDTFQKEQFSISNHKSYAIDDVLAAGGATAFALAAQEERAL